MSLTTIFVKTFLANATVLCVGFVANRITNGVIEQPSVWQAATFAAVLCIWRDMHEQKQERR